MNPKCGLLSISVLVILFETCNGFPPEPSYEYMYHPETYDDMPTIYNNHRDYAPRSTPLLKRPTVQPAPLVKPAVVRPTIKIAADNEAKNLFNNKNVQRIAIGRERNLMDVMRLVNSTTASMDDASKYDFVLATRNHKTYIFFVPRVAPNYYNICRNITHWNTPCDCNTTKSTVPDIFASHKPGVVFPDRLITAKPYTGKDRGVTHNPDTSLNPGHPDRTNPGSRVTNPDGRVVIDGHASTPSPRKPGPGGHDTTVGDGSHPGDRVSYPDGRVTRPGDHVTGSYPHVSYPGGDPDVTGSGGDDGPVTYPSDPNSRVSDSDKPLYPGVTKTPEIPRGNTKICYIVRDEFVPRLDLFVRLHSPYIRKY